MIDRHRDQISGTIKRTSERRISAPSLEKFSGGITPSQTVPATLQHYAQGSTIITSNRVIEDWPKLLGDVVVVAPLLDRLMHHGHLLRFEGKSWRLKEAAARVAKRGAQA